MSTVETGMGLGYDILHLGLSVSAAPVLYSGDVIFVLLKKTTTTRAPMANDLLESEFRLIGCMEHFWSREV